MASSRVGVANHVFEESVLVKVLRSDSICESSRSRVTKIVKELFPNGTVRDETASRLEFSLADMTPRWKILVICPEVKEGHQLDITPKAMNVMKELIAHKDKRYERRVWCVTISSELVSDSKMIPNSLKVLFLQNNEELANIRISGKRPRIEYPRSMTPISQIDAEKTSETEKQILSFEKRGAHQETIGKNSDPSDHLMELDDEREQEELPQPLYEDLEYDSRTLYTALSEIGFK